MMKHKARRAIYSMNCSSLVLVAFFCLSANNLNAGEVSGTRDGGGGGARVCTVSGKLQVTLYDYYENSEKNGPAFDLGPANLTYIEKVNYVLDRLKKFDPVAAARYQERANKFIEESAFVDESIIKDVQDGAEIIEPIGQCKRMLWARQIIEPGAFEARYLIDKNLWIHADENQRAGLILHEIILTDAYSFYKHTNSKSTRYYNSVISSVAMRSLTDKDYYQLLKDSRFFLDITYTYGDGTGWTRTLYRRKTAHSFNVDGGFFSGMIYQCGDPAQPGSFECFLASAIAPFLYSSKSGSEVWLRGEPCNENVYQPCGYPLTISDYKIIEGRPAFIEKEQVKINGQVLLAQTGREVSFHLTTGSPKTLRLTAPVRYKSPNGSEAELSNKYYPYWDSDYTKQVVGTSCYHRIDDSFFDENGNFSAGPIDGTNIFNLASDNSQQITLTGLHIIKLNDRGELVDACTEMPPLPPKKKKKKKEN